MIIGANLTLTPPRITLSEELLEYPEIQHLLKCIQEYFQQKHRIYDAEITVTNNEYQRINGEYGEYKKRIDYSFKLRYLEEITSNNNNITFILTENETYTIPVTDKFFYFIEWEDQYYQ